MHMNSITKITAMIALTICLMCLSSCAQDSSMNVNPVVSGVLEVSDQINYLGEVNTSQINDKIYENTDVVIWKVTPSMDTSGFYLTGLDFYAMLDQKKDTLFILIDSDNESLALRGMIPSLYGDDNYALSETPDQAHHCHEYNETKTLIHYVLSDVLSSLKTSKAVNENATLNMTPSYASSFSNNVSVIGYYVAAAEYDNNYNCFHNWPWGEGKDICRYDPGFSGCEYSDGWVDVIFNFNLTNAKGFYLFGSVYNDNSEESRYDYNGNMWMQQVNWGGKSDVKYGISSLPTQIELFGRKTWSVTSAHTWMAIDAESVSVSGRLFGQGPNSVNQSEEPDVLAAFAMEKKELSWPAEENVLPVYIDIKPGSCPNPINLKEKGVVSVAVLGSDDFNVTDIDPSSVSIGRAGVDDAVAPTIRWSLEDVATPFSEEPCACHELKGDGVLDLVLKFEAQSLAGALELNNVIGAEIPLTLKGKLNEAKGGEQFKGQDCVRIIKNKK